MKKMYSPGWGMLISERQNATMTCRRAYRSLLQLLMSQGQSGAKSQRIWGHVGTICSSYKTTRKRLLALRFRALHGMETVGVEDGSQAAARSCCGLRDFISAGGTLGGTLLHFKIRRKELLPCTFPPFSILFNSTPVQTSAYS